jgi:hypothetical protein
MADPKKYRFVFEPMVPKGLLDPLDWGTLFSATASASSVAGGQCGRDNIFFTTALYILARHATPFQDLGPGRISASILPCTERTVLSYLLSRDERAFFVFQSR